MLVKTPAVKSQRQCLLGYAFMTKVVDGTHKTGVSAKGSDIIGVP